MFQYSTFDKINNGDYDGGITIQEIRKKGDFGLGTFHQLEGELVIVENKFYQCYKRECKAVVEKQMIAWAALCHFPKNAQIHILKKNSYDDFRNNKIPFVQFKNHLVAVKVKGIFSFIELTSTPKQKKPYPTIQSVINQSTKYPIKNIQGTLVGWYAPEFMSGIKSSGFHFHFVDDQEKIGGHVLEFNLEEGTIQYSNMEYFFVQFPKDDRI